MIIKSTAILPASLSPLRLPFRHTGGDRSDSTHEAPQTKCFRTKSYIRADETLRNLYTERVSEKHRAIGINRP
jgi:hypothetical protein